MVVMSIEPGTSARRLVLALSVAAVAASLMLLPKSLTELRNWLAAAILTLLAVCYLGILLVPNLSVHLATDPQEPALAGAWRGVFGHKNMAAGMMAMVLFLGIYIMRAGSWLAGGIAVGLTLLFLINTEGKSALALCIAVLILTSLATMIRSFWFRAVVLLMPLVLMCPASPLIPDCVLKSRWVEVLAPVVAVVFCRTTIVTRSFKRLAL